MGVIATLARKMYNEGKMDLAELREFEAIKEDVLFPEQVQEWINILGNHPGIQKRGERRGSVSVAEGWR